MGGILVQSLLVMHILLLLSSIYSLSTTITPPQSDTVLPISPARELDTLLQGYAYKVVVGKPKTGISYDATLPSNLTGIRVSAMRVKSGSVYTRGVKKYKEFEFPKGISVSPYVERFVLIYQNLGNWSKTYYDLPGYTYLSPVLGLLAYDALNLSATNLPVLSVRVSGDPIAVHFTSLLLVKSAPPTGSVPKCVSINLNGSVAFSSVIPGYICLVRDQGHFSLAIDYIAPPPNAAAPPPPPPPPRPHHKKGKTKNKGLAIAGYVLFVVFLLSLLGLLAVVVFSPLPFHGARIWPELIISSWIR